MIRSSIQRRIVWLMQMAGLGLIAVGMPLFIRGSEIGAAAPPLAPLAQKSQATGDSAYPIPERIWIDKLKIDALIQPVGPGRRVGPGAVEWTAPNNRNVGWHDYSGRLGEGKNIVLNGHNNIYGGIFRKLYTLKPGDEIRLAAGDQLFVYRVEEVKILRERDQPLAVRIANAQHIQPMNDDRLTLVSCWPEWSNTHRVIVITRPVARN